MPPDDPPERPSTFRNARGRRRAAALMIAIGPDRAAEILKLLPDQDVQELMWEVTGVGKLTAEERQDILSTFYETRLGRDFVSVGGLQYAEAALEKALGKERAEELVMHLGSIARPRPFSFLRSVDMGEAAQFLHDEHPQVIALLLGHLDDTSAAQLLQALPEETQTEVTIRLATMDQTTPEVIREVEDILYARIGGISAVGEGPGERAGGTESIVEILRGVDLATETSVLQGIDDIDAATADEVRRHMFVFDNITLLDDRSVQRVLREVDSSDLGLALKGAAAEVSEVILRNMSERASRMLQDDMEAMGPARIGKVQEARGRIIAIVRRLEAAEEIFVMRGGGEDLVT
jgi:flagellar motor switch protein FliG